MKNTEISRWEKALADLPKLAERDWGDVLRRVDPNRWSVYGEDDAEANASNEFEEAASKHLIGKLCLEFPNSTHGDGCSVHVYRLPQGTCVLVPFATWEREDVCALVLHDVDFETLLETAKNMLFDDGDHGIVQNLDKETDFNPDADATYEGESSLRSSWNRVIGGGTPRQNPAA